MKSFECRLWFRLLLSHPTGVRGLKSELRYCLARL